MCILKVFLPVMQPRSGINLMHIICFKTAILCIHSIFFISTPQYFPANRDQNSIVCNPINPSIVTRYCRVEPRGWRSHISMRLEFYGCYTGTFQFFFYGYVLLSSVYGGGGGGWNFLIIIHTVKSHF